MSSYALFYNELTEEWDGFGGENVGRVLTQTVDDTLDSGTVVIELSTATPFKPFTLVRFMTTNIAYVEMCVLSDSVETYSKYTDNVTYNHTISLIEQTKILEKIIVNNLMLTNINDNLWEQFNKALDNAVLKYDDTLIDSIYFGVTSAVQPLLEGVPSEDFFFEGDNTLRDIIDEILSTVNCRVKANISTSKVITIGIVDLTAITDVAEIADIYGESYDNNADDFSGGIKATVSNAYIKNVIKQPKSSLKTKDEVLSTDNAIMQFYVDINELTKVEIYLDYDFEYSTDTGWETYTGYKNYAKPIDLTDVFVDQEVYDLMTVLEQALHIPYTRGTDVIDVNFGDMPFIGSATSFLIPIILGAVSIAIAEDLGLTGTVARFLTSDFVNDKKIIESMVYSAEYLPIIDTTINIDKPNNYSAFNSQLAIIDNQGSGSVDVARLGNNMLGNIMRTGNDEYYLDHNTDNFLTVLPLLSKYANDYVVYKRTMSVVDTAISRFYKVRYYMTKNFNNLAERVGINREKRIYSIPLSGEETYLQDRNYIYASLSAVSTSDIVKDTLSDNAMLAFGNTLRGEVKTGEKYGAVNTLADYLTPDRMVIKSYHEDGGTYSYTHELPVASYGAGNVINFKAKYYDNYSAGVSIGGQIIGGKKAVYNPYVNSDGEAFQFDYCIMNNQTATTLTYTNYKALPTTDTAYYAAIDKVTSNYISLYYKKDRSQQIAIVSSFSIMPIKDEFNDIVIGNKFAEYNNLTSKTVPDLYIALSSSVYSVSEKSKAKGDLLASKSNVLLSIANIASDVVKLEYIGTTISTEHNAWAICDANKNLYIAVNGNINDNNAIYFYSDKVLHE